MTPEISVSLMGMGFAPNPNRRNWTHKVKGKTTGRSMWESKFSGLWRVETKYTIEDEHPAFDDPIAAAVYLLMQDPDQ